MKSNYQSIFEITPIPIWIEDFSKIKLQLQEDGLIGKNPAEIKSFFDTNRNKVEELIRKLEIKDINKACLDLLHAGSKNELINQFHKLITPEVIKSVKEQFIAICSGTDNFQTESRIKTLKGEIKDIKLSWRVEPGYEESLESVIVITEDITSIKSLNKTLEERSRFIQTIFEQIPIGIAVNKISDGTTILVNKNFISIYGWPESILNNVDSFFLHVYPDPIQRDLIKNRILKDIESGDPSRMHWTNVEISTQKGEKKWVSATNIPLYDQDLMISTVYDETELFFTKDDLIHEKNLLRSLIDNIPDFIYVKDLESRHLIDNKANLKLFGSSTSEVQKSDLELFPKETAESFMADDQKVFKSQEPILHKEELIFDRDGNEIWLSTSKIPLIDQNTGKTKGLVGISRDITQDKKRELALLHKSKLLEAVGEVNRILLANEHWKKALDPILEILGSTILADRAYFFENYIDEKSGKLFTSQIAEWTNGKVSKEIDNPDYKAIDLEQHPIFLNALETKRYFYKLTKETSGETKKILEEQGIVTLLEIPIFLGNEFYGYLGFDDCFEEKKWTNEDISFLQTTCANVAIAIGRQNTFSQLEESQHQYKELFQLSPLPKWVYNSETFEILDANEAAILHYGYSHEEFLKMKLTDFQIQEEPMFLEREVTQKLKNNTSFLAEDIHRHKKKNEEIIFVEIKSKALKFHGLNAMVITANDITFRKRYLETIEKQNAKLKEIAWIQSHVVRAPLARLMGLMHLIENNRDQYLPIDSNELTQLILATAGELDGIIKEIIKKSERIKLDEI